MIKKITILAALIVTHLCAFAQVLSVDYPNGGETFTATNLEFITWTDNSLPLVKLEYSINNGATWNFIANATSFSGTGFYQWNVPNVTSSNCLVRVSNASNANDFDISDNVFEIVTPSITLFSPNGGETIAIGGTFDIYWLAPGIDFVDIEYSTNGGATFTSLATNVDASLTTYTWTPIPNTPSATCRLRIKQSSNPALNDVSDNNFTIGSASLTLTSPNGGEVFAINTGQYIDWTAVGVTDVDIEYSINGGNTWTFIGTQTGSPFYWWNPIPNTPSSNCLIRIKDANNTTISDVSDAPFTIAGGNITLYTPAGGNTWSTGSVNQISWDAPGINSVKIEYSFDSMATWNTIVANYTTPGNYNWTIPNTPSNDCFVRVSNTNDLSVFDINQAPFTITAPYITVVYPNGGETFQSGYDYFIEFDAVGVDSAMIEYSINGGTTWTPIISSYAIGSVTNYYQWVVPNTPSNNCLLRIKDTQTGAIIDQSDFSFAIVFGGLPSCATNFFPGNGVQQFSRNPSFSWSEPQSSPVVTGYDFYFGTTANPPLYQANVSALNFQILNLNPSTTYYWQVIPNSVNGQAQSCVVSSFTTAAANEYNMDNQQETVCSGLFYDVAGPNANYNQNELYVKTFLPSTAGQVLKFVFSNFSTEQGFDFLRIYNGNSVNAPLIGTYSGVNGPGTLVASNPQGALTFRWNSDNVISEAGWQAAISCVPVGTQAINLTSPNGGESWIANTTKTITWTSQNISLINLEYSIDNGATWSAIASGISNTGSYNWQVPLPASTQCLVRASAANNANVFDISNANFEIQFVPVYVDLLTPATAETFLTGSTALISWNSMFVSNVNLEYSTDAGSTWNAIVSNISSTDGYNSYSWTIPNTPSNLYLLRITDASNVTITDQSSGAFYVVAPYLEVASPNGGEILGGATYSSISWSGFITTSYVDIDYSSDNGNTWSNLVTNRYHNNGSVANNYYNWFVNNVNSSNCRIRIKESANASIDDESNNSFTINANSSTITITQPNGGEQISGGSNYSVQWNASFVSGFFKVQFSSNNGTTWSTLANNLNNSGFYNWLVPNQSMSNCLIKVIDVNDSTIFDVSNASFAVTQTNPYISDINPNGGEVLTVGNYTGITWNSAMVPTVDILFSDDGGATYSTIISNLSNINFYNWLVPNAISNNCIIKVRAAGNNTLFDVSDAVFSIVAGTPSISLVNPNGGENFLGNTPNNVIQWTGTGIGGAIKIEYSSDAGATWNTIINSFAAVNNIYNWFTPNIVSNQCLVRVSSVSNPTISDVSDTTFNIGSSAPQLVVSSPNGGEYLNQGFWYNIAWTRNNVPLINLSYSTDSGATWNTLLSAVNANSYYWNVPNVSSSQCLIRVDKSGAGAPLSDVSNALFTIGPLQPNSNTIVIDTITSIPFCKLDTFQVYYTATGTYNPGNVFDVQLSDSVGNFTNAVLIGQLTSTASSGFISCVVPSTVLNGLGYRMRIQSSDLPATSNDNGFNIPIVSPQFDFAANNLIKYLPDGAVTFFVIPQQSASATYLWDFGDGGTSSQAQPTHNYSIIGKFNVSCTVAENGCSLTVEKIKYIRVEQLFPSIAINTNTTVDITDVTMLSADTALMTLKNGNCLLSTDGGITWNTSVTGLVAGSDTLLSCDMFPGKWRVVGNNGLIRESTDNGQTWQPMQSPTSVRMYGVATLDNNRSYAVGDAGVILNYDGNNWVQQNTGVAARFWDVAVDKTAPTPTAYAVGSGGTIFKLDSTTWSPQNSGVSGGLFGTTALGNNVVYAVGGLTQGLILKTTNGGLTWNTVLNGVDVSFRSVSGIADTAWACAFDGIIYETRDGGSSWVRYSVGDTYNNNGINFRTSRGIVVGNAGNGRVFGLPSETDTTGLRKQFYAPNQLLIYPNPAQHIVTLKGKFAKSSIVNFVIKDIDGKIVLNLPKQNIQNGELNFSFNISKLSNGVYFVFADDGVNSFVKKLVIAN
ncbi:MAG: T9SS type A sorting domain-containing protein [Bacteroidota bacterium]